MKNPRVAEHYNQVYSDDQNAFSGEPLPLVKVLVQHLKQGNILEIGAGGGRNCLFLAAQGFTVKAIDISEKSVELIRQRAEEGNTKLEVEVADVAEYLFQDMYDAIICTFTFHHLSIEDAKDVIQKMQDHTKEGGFNVITAFTKNGDFFRKHPDTQTLYLDNKEQMEVFYKDWAIFRSFEKEGKARAVGEDGKPQFNVFAGLLAQKP